MSDLKTLHKVVDIAERRRDDARAALAQQQRELQIAHEQLQQLQTYAQEAHQRWAARSSSIGVDAQQLFHKLKPLLDQHQREMAQQLESRKLYDTPHI